MKILSIVPGFGGTFYCGNCLRDSVYTKTLTQLGHDIVVLPIYLPLTSAKTKQKSLIPVFYGAVNIYLKQNFKIFRNMPSWVYRLLDSQFILRYAAKKSGSTRSEGLEEMTISMLQGVNGNQHEELEQLCNYIKYHNRPDIIHLSNALLLGLAQKLKDELNIPIVCSLQDEDVWVDTMREPFRSRIWDLMKNSVEKVDALVSVSSYFAREMKVKMAIPENKLHVIPIGIDTSLYKVYTPSFQPIVIGYLSRMCEDNGFEILIDAYIILKKNPKFKDARLRLTGGKTDDDSRFIKQQIKKLKAENYFDSLEFINDFKTENLSHFFNGLTVLSVPVIKGEAFGLYQLESIASGIPVVQPQLGAFPEISNATQGEVIYSPNTAEALAAAFADLIVDSKKLLELSLAGRKSVENNFNNKIVSNKMIALYKQFVDGSL